MYGSVLFVHWKQIRVALVPFIVASFVLPLLSVQGLGTSAGTAGATLEAYRAVSSMEVWLPLFPLLAAAIGTTLALSAWNWDHQLDHVHALSLPVPRWRYVLLKMGAGATLTLTCVAALWVGSWIAAASVSLPEGLHAYPNQLSVRFLLAILVMYALFFAMAAGTTRTALVVVGTVLVILIVGGAVSNALASTIPIFERVNIADVFLDALMNMPGPFHVFTGTWSLIDV